MEKLVPKTPVQPPTLEKLAALSLPTPASPPRLLPLEIEEKNRKHRFPPLFLRPSPNDCIHPSSRRPTAARRSSRLTKLCCDWQTHQRLGCQSWPPLIWMSFLEKGAISVFPGSPFSHPAGAKSLFTEVMVMRSEGRLTHPQSSQPSKGISQRDVDPLCLFFLFFFFSLPPTLTFSSIKFFHLGRVDAVFAQASFAITVALQVQSVGPGV